MLFTSQRHFSFTSVSDILLNMFQLKYFNYVAVKLLGKKHKTSIHTVINWLIKCPVF